MLMLDDEYSDVPHEDYVEADYKRIRGGSERLVRAIRKKHPERFPEPPPKWKNDQHVGASECIGLHRTFASFGLSLVHTVAAAMCCTPGDLLGACRKPHLVDARAVVVGVLRARGWSYPQIGALLGRDHSTIINLDGKLAIYRKRNAACDEVWHSLTPFKSRLSGGLAL